MVLQRRTPGYLCILGIKKFPRVVDRRRVSLQGTHMSVVTEIEQAGGVRFRAPTKIEILFLHYRMFRVTVEQPRAVFEKTSATSQKNVKVMFFWIFKKKRKKR